ncbi:MAG: GTP 3',8-cyclase MoaA [Chloroflexota bacterium]
MQDSFGRTIDYLRISVTEACNFRCVYCAPNGHIAPALSPLTVEEIERVVRAVVALGVSKIRLTGGEPLLRRDIVEIVRAVAAVAGVRDLALTTNGFLLAPLARELAVAGLNRVNISLDTLRRERFVRITGVNAFDAVWAGIHAAEAAGLAPVKINVVALRGINDDEFEDFARLTLAHPWHVRFIELMPVGANAAARDLFNRHFISADELIARLPELAQSDGPRGNGPARTYRLPGAETTIGFITPASEHFCNACNRIRVTAHGAVCACLFGSSQMDLRQVLCENVNASALRELLARAIGSKPEQHPSGDDFAIHVQAMSKIGG